jgi:hypothetical protein
MWSKTKDQKRARSSALTGTPWFEAVAVRHRSVLQSTIRSTTRPSAPTIWSSCPSRIALT